MVFWATALALCVACVQAQEEITFDRMLELAEDDEFLMEDINATMALDDDDFNATDIRIGENINLPDLDQITPGQAIVGAVIFDQFFGSSKSSKSRKGALRKTSKSSKSSKRGGILDIGKGKGGILNLGNGKGLRGKKAGKKKMKRKGKKSGKSKKKIFKRKKSGLL